MSASSQLLITQCMAFLAEYAQNDTTRIVYVADENADGDPQTLAQGASLTVISNRVDIAEQCARKDINTLFCDFVFDSIASDVDIALYRISKERAVCHHVFKQLHQKLKPGGRLFISGRKNEGIKGYCDKLTKTGLFSGKLKKHKDIYTAILMRTDAVESYQTLDDKNYPALRRVGITEDLQPWSKPGLFGWNKEDLGSKLLIESLEQSLAQENTHPKGFRPRSVLDLGCGYGYLSMRALSSTLNSVEHLTATDNNAAALLAAEKNIADTIKKQQLATQYQIHADDCAKTLKGRFDLVLCNPPFHQGFANDSRLTDKFINTAQRLTADNGRAYFVVNSFIPLEILARTAFSKIVTIHNTAQFKVICLSQA